MFVKICVITCSLGIVLALQSGDLEKYGPFRMMLHSPLLKCIQNRSLDLDVNKTIVYFYDFVENYTVSFPIQDAAEGILKLPTIDTSKRFIMFVGGFTSSIHNDIEEQIREAYKTYPDSYLLIPDHSAYTYDAGGSGMKSYDRSVTYTHFIGKAIGQMMAQLKNGGVCPKNMHLVGHSLGGQMLGHAGSTFMNITGEKIARITALDPAGPCFVSSRVEEQVRSGVADHVDIYHCNSGTLGSSRILGDIDFVINRRGEVQSNCNTPVFPALFDSSRAASCNHRYCVDLWTASVKNRDLFQAYRCGSYENVMTQECAVHKTIAGSANPGTERGIFFFSTENQDLKELR